MAKLEEIRSEIMTLIRQAEGLSTSPYTDALLTSVINATFDTLFEYRLWKDHKYTVEDAQLLGVNGLVYDKEATPALYNLKAIFREAKHIKFIFPENWERALPEIPTSINPNVVTNPGFERYNIGNSLIRILPKQTVCSLTIVGRYREKTQYVEGDEIPFDKWAMIYSATAKYFTEEAANKDAAQMYGKLAESRLKTLEASDMADSYSLYGQTIQATGDWRDAP